MTRQFGAARVVDVEPPELHGVCSSLRSYAAAGAGNPEFTDETPAEHLRH